FHRGNYVLWRVDQVRTRPIPNDGDGSRGHAFGYGLVRAFEIARGKNKTDLGKPQGNVITIRFKHDGVAMRGTVDIRVKLLVICALNWTPPKPIVIIGVFAFDKQRVAAVHLFEPSENFKSKMRCFQHRTNSHDPKVKLGARQFWLLE